MWTKKPARAIGAPLLVFALHGLALSLGVYQSVVHFDSLMHFSGGAAAALFLGWGLNLGSRQGWWPLPSLWLSRLLLLGCVSLVTQLWEVYELLLQPEWQPSIADTVKDQVLGVFGGGVVIAFYKEAKGSSQ